MAAVATLAVLIVSVAGCEKKAPPAMAPPDVEVVTATEPVMLLTVMEGVLPEGMVPSLQMRGLLPDKAYVPTVGELAGKVPAVALSKTNGAML